MSAIDDLIDDEIEHHAECGMRGMSLRQSNCACELALRSSARAELAAMREVIARADDLEPAARLGFKIAKRVAAQSRLGQEISMGYQRDFAADDEAEIIRMALDAYRAARESVK